jgi:hypothetical protein
MLIGTLIGAFFCGLWVYLRPWCLYADSNSYLLMTGGVYTISPYRSRVLIPWLLSFLQTKTPPPHMPKGGTPIMRWSRTRVMLTWAALSWVSLSLSSGLIYLLTERAGAPGWVGSVLFCALPWYRMLSFGAFMVDQFSMLCALACAFLPLEYAIPIAFVGGVAHERSPVFAALFAQEPWLLVGVIGALVFMFFGPRGKVQPYEDGWVNYPLSAYQYHRTNPIADYFVCWGAVLFGLSLSPHVLLVLVIAYGQLLVGRDRSRLIQWAAPVLIPSAASFIVGFGETWMLIVLVLHVSMMFMRPTEVGKSVDGNSDVETIVGARLAA